MVGSYGNNSNTGSISTFTSETIYEKNFTVVRYTLRQTLTVGVPGDRFGASLALSDDGTLLAVGAPGINSSTGGLYILACDPGSGICGNATLLAEPFGGGSPGDNYGSAVALSLDGSLLFVAGLGAAVNGSGGIYSYHCTAAQGCACNGGSLPTPDPPTR